LADLEPVQEKSNSVDGSVTRCSGWNLGSFAAIRAILAAHAPLMAVFGAVVHTGAGLHEQVP